jgi:ribosomal protein S18 acetylase RimI-like enzyme
MAEWDAMPSCVIRAARPADAGTLAVVHARSWRTAYRGIVPDAVLDNLDREIPAREARWRRALEGDSTDLVYVAEAPPEGIVGFCRGGAARPPHFGFEAEVSALYLLAEFRRRGVGGTLVRELAGSLAAAGYRSMMAWVLSANPAVRFYERLGGERLGTALVVIGGRPLEETAYGWTDLTGLSGRPGGSATHKPF